MAKSFAQLGNTVAALEQARKTLALIETTQGQSLDTSLLTAKAVAYRDLADAHTALAQNTRTASCNQKELWRAARNYEEQSLTILLAMKNKGTLSPTESQMIEEVKSDMAKCDAGLAK